jgi:hypothetical protein
LSDISESAIDSLFNSDVWISLSPSEAYQRGRRVPN